MEYKWQLVLRIAFNVAFILLGIGLIVAFVLGYWVALKDDSQYVDTMSAKCDRYKDSVVANVPVACYRYLGL